MIKVGRGLQSSSKNSRILQVVGVNVLWLFVRALAARRPHAAADELDATPRRLEPGARRDSESACAEPALALRVAFKIPNRSDSQDNFRVSAAVHPRAPVPRAGGHVWALERGGGVRWPRRASEMPDLGGGAGWGGGGGEGG
jgi:hypothetical protein